MYEPVEKVVKIVEEINLEIFECTGETEMFVGLDVNTNGDVTTVSFCGFHIWDSEMDPREWDEGGPPGTEKIEPLGPWIRRELERLLRLLGKIKVKDAKSDPARFHVHIYEVKGKAESDITTGSESAAMELALKAFKDGQRKCDQEPETQYIAMAFREEG